VGTLVQQIKCRCVPLQAINACGGVHVEGNALLTLAVVEWWAVSFTPRLPFPRGKCPQYTLSRRLGGPPGDLDVRELSLAAAGKRSVILRTGNLLPTPYTGCVVPIRLCCPAAPMMFIYSESIRVNCSFSQHCTKVTRVEILVFFNIDGRPLNGRPFILCRIAFQLDPRKEISRCIRTNIKS